MPRNPTDDKSALVQVMAWGQQATSHYQSLCWPNSMSRYCVTRHQWVESLFWWKIINVNHNSLYIHPKTTIHPFNLVKHPNGWGLNVLKLKKILLKCISMQSFDLFFEPASQYPTDLLVLTDKKHCEGINWIYAYLWYDWSFNNRGVVFPVCALTIIFGEVVINCTVTRIRRINQDLRFVIIWKGIYND